MAAGAVTADLARWIARGDDPPTPRSRQAACHALLDWAGVTLASVNDPLVKLLIEEAQTRGPGSPVIGTKHRCAPAIAARVNGAASHVLDFDDINKRMRGHPSVAILPAVLAACDDHTGAQVIDALITGTEVACALGEMLGEAHYLRGFHTTATVGTVAAAAGVCRLLRLDQDASGRALSIAATQAAGLRAMFGTMVKPLHAGLAAERGLMAARWVVLGMSAPLDGIEHPQGLGPVLSDGFHPYNIRPDPSAPFGIEENVYKRHAACYYTHSAIEVVQALCRDHGLTLSKIERVTIGLQPGLHSVCDIKEPTTGLEVKFSIRHLVAMALSGRDTTNPEGFTEALAMDPDLVQLRQRVTVSPLETDNRMLASATITTSDGKRVDRQCDVSAPASDLSAQENDLTAKFLRLARPILGARAPDVAARILAVDDDRPIAQLLNDLTPET
ncbi:MAG: MmgE/PrpD family protein [Roseovarius sp.]